MEDQERADPARLSRRSLKHRRTRLLIYLAVLLVVAAWRYVPRPWHPAITIETAHHIVFSSGTRQQTDQTIHALNLLYTAYSNRLSKLANFEPDHHKLKVKLFKNRSEFRWVNPNLGWVEAFYREPYCQAYFSEGEANPYHWMLHESVHQLNREVAHLKLEKWLEEGLADYFATSELEPNDLAVGRIDPNTYPVWWMELIATNQDLSENIHNGTVIPLRAIITTRGGPSMNSHFNLYYLHWWTLAHFVFETPRYRDHALELLERGGGLDAFEQTIGPVQRVQSEWHAYVLGLKKELGFGAAPAVRRRGDQ